MKNKILIFITTIIEVALIMIICKGIFKLEEIKILGGMIMLLFYKQNLK